MDVQSTFVLFQKLPAEIRHLVWDNALPRRTLNIRRRKSSANTTYLLICNTPHPALFSVDRDSRQHTRKQYVLLYDSLKPRFYVNSHLDTIAHDPQTDYTTMFMELIFECPIAMIREAAFDMWEFRLHYLQLFIGKLSTVENLPSGGIEGLVNEVAALIAIDSRFIGLYRMMMEKATVPRQYQESPLFFYPPTIKFLGQLEWKERVMNCVSKHVFGLSLMPSWAC